MGEPKRNEQTAELNRIFANYRECRSREVDCECKHRVLPASMQPPHWNLCRAPVLDQHVSVVVPMQAKAVLLLAEWACPGSLVDENVRRRLVGIEPAMNRK